MAVSGHVEMAIRLWPKSWWRRVVVVFAVALFVPYLASRVLSPWRQVRVYSGKFVPENIDGGIRIVAYNIAHRRGSAESKLRCARWLYSTGAICRLVATRPVMLSIRRASRSSGVS